MLHSCQRWIIMHNLLCKSRSALRKRETMKKVCDKTWFLIMKRRGKEEFFNEMKFYHKLPIWDFALFDCCRVSLINFLSFHETKLKVSLRKSFFNEFLKCFSFSFNLANVYWSWWAFANLVGREVQSFLMHFFPHSTAI